MVGVLKNKLRSNVPSMSHTFQMRIEKAVALKVTPSNGMHAWRRKFAAGVPALTYRLDQYNQKETEWTMVRLMPALLRIFTRVNLLAFIGEDQGTALSKSSPRKMSDRS